MGCPVLSPGQWLGDTSGVRTNSSSPEERALWSRVSVSGRPRAAASCSEPELQAHRAGKISIYLVSKATGMNKVTMGRQWRDCREGLMASGQGQGRQPFSKPLWSLLGAA